MKSWRLISNNRINNPPSAVVGHLHAKKVLSLPEGDVIIKNYRTNTRIGPIGSEFIGTPDEILYYLPPGRYFKVTHYPVGMTINGGANTQGASPNPAPAFQDLSQDIFPIGGLDPGSDPSNDPYTATYPVPAGSFPSPDSYIEAICYLDVNLAYSPGDPILISYDPPNFTPNYIINFQWPQFRVGRILYYDRITGNTALILGVNQAFTGPQAQRTFNYIPGLYASPSTTVYTITLGTAEDAISSRALLDSNNIWTGDYNIFEKFVGIGQGITSSTPGFVLDVSGNVSISNGELNMNNEKITGLATGTNPSDAVNVSQLSGGLGNYLPLAGGTMTGSITFANSIGNAINMGTSNRINYDSSISIGAETGQAGQATESIAIGIRAGKLNQLGRSVAIGYETAVNNQGDHSVAVGSGAGQVNQGSYSVAIGHVAGYINQRGNSVAIANSAGQYSQGNNAVAIGISSGNVYQYDNAVAVGAFAGKTAQGTNAVAIGNNAAYFNQGSNSIAIGNLAGYNNQNESTIVINATGSALNTATNNAFYAKPIRNATTSNGLFYNATSGEITYDTLSNSYLPLTGGTLTGSLNLTSGNTYKINNTDVLSSTTLGSGVTNSSLTSVGTLNNLNVNGQIYGGSVHVGGTVAVNTQGAHIQWNRTGGNGKTYILNQKGTGAGGIIFGEVTTSNVATTGMELSPTGSLLLNSSVGVSDDPQLYIYESTSKNRLDVFTNLSTNGGYNPVTKRNDIVILAKRESNLPSTSKSSLTIANYSDTTNAIRLDSSNNTISIDTGGGNSLGTERIILDGSNNTIGITTTNLNLNGSVNIVNNNSLKFPTNNRMNIGQNITNANNNTIAVNMASSGTVTTGGSDRCYITPIRNASNSNALYYDSTTKEITYDTAGGGGGSNQIVEYPTGASPTLDVNAQVSIFLQSSNTNYILPNGGSTYGLTKTIINQIPNKPSLPYDSAWSSPTLTSGLNNRCRAITIDNTNQLVYIGGDFTNAGGVTASRIAKWDGSSWSTVGNGFGGNCYSLTIDSSNNIYAGGNFQLAGGTLVNGIGKWNGTNWSALGTGLDPPGGGVAFAIAVDSSNNIYVGGDYTTAGEVSASRIAKWNVSTSTWSALGSGLNNVCYSIAIDSSNNIYAGGNFTTAGGVNASRIAKWNVSTSTWSALGSGLDGSCNSVTIDSSNNIYVGGNFTTAGGISASNIAKWNVSTSTWSALGSGLDGSCNTITIISNNNIYVGGNFTNAGGNSANYIANWDGSSWSALGSGLNDICQATAKDNTYKLYVGGNFTTAGGTSAIRIAKYGSYIPPTITGTFYSSTGSLGSTTVNYTSQLQWANNVWTILF